METSKNQSERSQKGHQYKIKCLRQMNAGKNMMTTRFQPLNIKLTGHTDSVTTISCLGDYLVSGGKDNLVKLWNIKDRSCKTFSDHKSWITSVNLINDYCVSGGADNSVRIYPIDSFMGKEASYKHPGYITSISKLSENKVLSY